MSRHFYIPYKTGRLLMFDGKYGMLTKVGSWAFIIGIVLSIISGFWELDAWWTSILIIMGLLVGLLNIKSKEATKYLWLAVALVIVSTFGGQVLSNLWPVLQRMLDAIVVFIIPSTIVVAIKEVFLLAGK